MSLPRHSIVAFIVAATFFMENLDATVIATALPAIAESFGRQPVDLNIGITAYVLAIAVFIPISGWIAERFGPHRVFTAAIAVFTLASIACGAAQTLEQFVLARVAQGIGGAMMVPVGRLVVLRITEKKDLVQAVAYITWPGLIAPILGPPVGGLITTYASWPWIFYLNVPLGLIAMYFAWTLTPRDITFAPRPLDLTGFLLLGGGCAALLYGVEQSGLGHAIAPSLAWVTAGIALILTAAWHMRRATHPLIDLSNLREPNYRVALAGGSLFRMSINAAPFLLPLTFQLAFGMNPFHAGLLLLALFAGNLAIKPATTAIMKRFGLRRVLIVNGLLCAFSLSLFALLSPAWPLAATLALLFVSGLFRSLQFTANNTLAFADIPKPKMSHASTLFSATFQLSIGMGVAVGALALRAAMSWNGHAEPALADFQVAFLVVAAIGLLGTLDAFWLKRDAGDHVTGHNAKSEQAAHRS
ncbi:MFS transporter [Pseudomonas matsuisoli]|uniref:MFS transporter n=1 Tax=Pseudomonas matsuisoli TaxID=1515666 RepID=UPI001E31D495|nr:MFS transporter [Pseudomonas matsuisoli]